jgi:hypothetical protein
VKLVSQTIACTERASRALQTRPPTTYYLHAKSVANGSFEDLGLVGCEWKGQSTYYDRRHRDRYFGDGLPRQRDLANPADRKLVCTCRRCGLYFETTCQRAQVGFTTMRTMPW